MKKTKNPRRRKFHLTVRILTDTGIWETQSIPLVLSKTRIRPMGVIVYEEKRKGEVLYLTEYAVG